MAAAFTDASFVAAQLGGLFLATAGIAKVLAPARTAEALLAYGVPHRLPLRKIAILLAICEITTGSAFLVTAHPALAFAVAGWYFLFAGLIAIGRRRGIADCGCLGSAPSAPDSAHLVMNILLGVACATYALRAPGPHRILPPGTALVIGLYGAMLLAGAALLTATIGTRTQISARLRAAGEHS
ncbi:MAG: MauE/DoxX family redox-associated membrane protein [Acidimicrobiia bacterium]